MMDNLTYHYAKDGNGNFINNRLLHVNDSQTNKSIYGEDIDDQEIEGIAYSQGNPYSQNYAYDKIGNLIADKQEEIAEIKWNVQGKVTDIIRKAGSDKANLHFKYDAMGNRISKSVVPKNVVDADTITTYYVRDAQGNVMAVYDKKTYDNANEELFLAEQHLYGSSRLGMRQMNVLLANSNNGAVANPDFTDAEKNYELTNHLGNVMAVVSSEKNSDGTADVKSVSDYYPFGMGMPGRSFSSGEYRYGFNGAEKINEYSGTDRTYDLGSRIYNPLLGRQFTPDPREKEYPWQSTYAYYANSPIWKVDYKGEGEGGEGTYNPANNGGLQEDWNIIKAAGKAVWNGIKKIPSLFGNSKIDRTGTETHSMVSEDAQGQGQDNSIGGTATPMNVETLETLAPGMSQAGKIGKLAEGAEHFSDITQQFVEPSSGNTQNSQNNNTNDQNIIEHIIIKPHTVLGDRQTDKNKGEINRHRGDTIEIVKTTLKIDKNTNKIIKKEVNTELYIPARYKKQ